MPRSPLMHIVEFSMGFSSINMLMRVSKSYEVAVSLIG